MRLNHPRTNETQSTIRKFSLTCTAYKCALPAQNVFFSLPRVNNFFFFFFNMSAKYCGVDISIGAKAIFKALPSGSRLANKKVIDDSWWNSNRY